MNSAIVIGGNHHNTLGVIRSLGREGIMSIVILHTRQKNNYVLKSKYVKKSVLAFTSEEILSSLNDLRDNDKKQVVLCTSDYAASIIDKGKDQLGDFFYLPGCQKSGELTYLMNKEIMRELALDCGLNVPLSFKKMKTDNNFSNVIYPCITKPIASIEGGKGDIQICQNEKELRHYFEKSSVKEVQLQQYINKILEFQLIGVANNGEILIPGRSRILTQPLSTNTGFLRYEKLDGSEPLEKCIEFIKKTGYSGLFSMEFIRDREGTDYFMEINFRNDGNAICVTEAGVNLPYLWYCSCIHKDKLLLSNKMKREIYVMPEYTEIDLWHAGDISIRRMYNEFRKADAFMEYATDDPNPTNGRVDLIKYITKTVIKKMIGR